jgi:hypothetical protein
MFKLIVIGKNGREESDFSTQAEAQAHFDSVRLTGHWGYEEYTIDHPEIPGIEAVEAIEAVQAVGAQEVVIDEDGVIVVPAIEAVEGVEAVEAVVGVDTIPAWAETIPAQFTWSIVPVTPPLADLSPRQIALALLSIGITEAQVILAINQLPSPLKEQGVIAWNRSNYFVRTEPAVAMIGTLAGLTSAQLDDIWKVGVTL